MPVGPKGEKRPADPIQQAVMVAKIATGEIEEEYVEMPTSTPQPCQWWEEGRKGTQRGPHT